MTESKSAPEQYKITTSYPHTQQKSHPIISTKHARITTASSIDKKNATKNKSKKKMINQITKGKKKT